MAKLDSTRCVEDHAQCGKKLTRCVEDRDQCGMKRMIQRPTTIDINVSLIEFFFF